MLKCSFGGKNDMFVACGSEDGVIYVWYRYNSKSFTQLKGHKLSVNFLQFHPTNPSLLISASDDYTIKLWAPEAEAKQKNVPIITDFEDDLINIEEEKSKEENEGHLSDIFQS